MADLFARVMKGDPLRIQAEAYNAALDVAEDFMRRGRPTGGHAIEGVTDSHRLVVLIRNQNSDGSDLDVYATVTAPNGHSVGAFPLTIEDEGNEVNSRPVIRGYFDVNGYTPSDSILLVTQEPIAIGEVGRAVVCGVTMAKVDILEVGHNFADNTGTKNILTSGPSGRVRILAYADPLAAGEQYCLVNVSQSNPKVGSYTANPGHDAFSADGATDCLNVDLGEGFHTLHTMSLPVGWYQFKVYAKGGMVTFVDGGALVSLERDVGFGYSNILPIRYSYFIASATTVPLAKTFTPYSLDFLHYVYSDTHRYRLRIQVGGANTFSGVVGWTATPTVRHINMTNPTPP